jgi:hypothetical protein
MHQSTSPEYKKRPQRRAAVLPAQKKGRPKAALAGSEKPSPYARADTLLLEERLKAA